VTEIDAIETDLCTMTQVHSSVNNDGKPLKKNRRSSHIQHDFALNTDMTIIVSLANTKVFNAKIPFLNKS
jgi:hypothetical protein